MVLERDDGIDQYLYSTTGVVVAADTVHHIIPLKDDWSRRVDPDNLISLSAASHAEVEKAYKAGGTERMEMQQKLKNILENRARGV